MPGTSDEIEAMFDGWRPALLDRVLGLGLLSLIVLSAAGEAFGLGY